jgi:hypothetical protein
MERLVTDYYDPMGKTLVLSPRIARRATVLAVGVAGHEVGHAVQDAEGYPLMRLRTFSARWLIVLSTISPFAFIGGFFLGSVFLMWLAVGILALQVFLPFSAPGGIQREQAGYTSTRATTGDRRERGRVRRVLRAAALIPRFCGGEGSGVLLLVHPAGCSHGPPPTPLRARLLSPGACNQRPMPVSWRPKCADTPPVGCAGGLLLVDFDLFPQRTALINVDLQTCFVRDSPIVPEAPAVLERLNRLAAVCRQAGITVIHTRFVLGPMAPTWASG